MKKRFISAFLLSAMLLTACKVEITPPTPPTKVTLSEEAIAAPNTESDGTTAVTEAVHIGRSELTADEASKFIPPNGVADAMAENILTQYIGEAAPEAMSDENSAALGAAFRNIRINNSRFALPLMVSALPDGFTVTYDYESEYKDEATGYNSYGGELFCNGVSCAEISIFLKDGADEKYGIIVTLVATSGYCKWDFDGIGYSNDTEKIKEKFGEPSAYAKYGSADGNLIYVDEIGSTAIFWKQYNSVLCVGLDFEHTAENALLVESVPYDDFDGMSDMPKLSGNPRELDWHDIFDNSCLTIGNDNYPVNAKISDLSEDIFLFDYEIGTEYAENSEYLSDSYRLMYKDREMGMVFAVRKSNEQAENAHIIMWMFLGVDEYPFPGGVLNVPFSQAPFETAAIYTGAEGENTAYRYDGVIETEEEKYLCSFMTTEISMVVAAIPFSVDPEAYNEFVEN